MRLPHTGLVLALASALLVLGPQLGHADPDPAPVGDWQGVLEIPNGSVRFVMHVTRTEDGTLSTTLDSPDQGDYDIQTGTTTYENGTLTVRVPHLNASYTGQVEEGAIDGTWSQHGRAFPLTLEPTEAEVETEAGGR